MNLKHLKLLGLSTAQKTKKKIKKNHSIKPESVLDKGFPATSVQLTTTAVLWLMLC